MEKIKKESPVRARMKQFLNRVQMSEGSFEQSIEMSTGWVSNIGDSIRIKTLSQISKPYPNLNINWLVSGVGEMLISDNNQSETKMIQQPTEGYIPVYDITFSLGFTPTFLDSQNNPDVLGYVDFAELRGSKYIVQAKGSSMSPLINDGDFVGIRPMKSKKIIDYGNPYGIIMEEHAVFKRIEPASTEDKIMLVSENPKHAPYEITKEEVIHLFSVIGILSVKSITY